MSGGDHVGSTRKERTREEFAGIFCIFSGKNFGWDNVGKDLRSGIVIGI